MFDVEQLVEACRVAAAGDGGAPAVAEVLRRALARPGEVAEAAGGAPAGLTMLYRGPDLTVINAVWPPRMALFPHDHRMWAAIAIYGGQEDNAFYRRQDGALVAAGGRELAEGDVLLLGPDAVHSVRNPRARHTGAIHVYGGDFVGTPRSQWDEGTGEERPYDLEEVRRLFADAEASLGGAGDRRPDGV